MSQNKGPLRTYVVAGLMIVLASLLMMAPSGRDELLAQESNRAAVIVRFGDDTIESRCVAFDEAQISGYDLLVRSGLAADTSFVGMGATVCRIEQTGCDADACFCQCRAGGDDCVYWSYWHLGEEGWSYASIGASTYQVNPGDVDGWSWGPGSPNSAIEPPTMSFEAVCSEGVSGSALGDGANSTTSEPATADDGQNLLPYIVLTGIVVLLGILTAAMQRRRE